MANVGTVSSIVRGIVGSGAFCLVVGLSGCGGPATVVDSSRPSRGPAVAKVAGCVVTKDALGHWSSLLAGRSTTGPAHSATAEPSSSSSPGNRALEFLISSERTICEAEEMRLKVTPAEVKSTLEQLGYNRYGLVAPVLGEAQLERLLSLPSETAADRRWVTRVHLLAVKIKRRQRSEAERAVPAALVTRYYQAHRRRFVEPERRDVEAIMTFRKASAEKAKREIEAGKSFLSVASYANEQPSEGGLRKNLSRRSLGPKRYEQDFFAPVRLNTLIGPLKERLYYIYEVTRVVPAKQLQLTQVQARIRRHLIEGPQRRLLALRRKAAARRWRDATSCSPGYVARQCS